jgi:hypothetical protein
MSGLRKFLAETKDMAALSVQERVANTNEDQERGIPFGVSLLFIWRYAPEGTRKGGTSAHTGAKIANR